MNDSDSPVAPPALIPILTTEHFTLQTARGVIMSEIGSRATIYLTAVSSSVVALAFVTSLSESPQAVRGFILVLLPVLAFMGFVTKARLVQLSYTDFHYVRAINRIRHFYVDVAPESAPYFMLSTHDDVPGVVQSAFYQNGRRMGVMTASVMIAVVNYVIVGLLGGVLVAWATGAGALVLFAAGVVVGLATAFVDLRREADQWRRYEASLDTRFPTPDGEL